eukprot:CAMPEP_0181440602 /NCGR_PEP_ID=MMETSP1110-20121109/23055_1 /TAXON_ID=174948 /ORGANISM="Symbiodinium sp., Strain CCMP421" /LENGTH=165 /DNA_ID=CAMNT_0023564417 /DNA_START=68 /DNA_END=565 /DNA_ORIENTATION=-
MPAEIAKDGTMKEALVSAGTAALTPRQVGLTLSSPGPSPGPSPRVGQSPNESRAASFRRSAALGFLEEKLHIQMESDRPCTRELLYRGVSADGQGRKEYLKRRTRYDIHERYEQPQTEAQVMSLSLRMNSSALRPPSFGKKPIIANTFYRTRGAGGFKEATADIF